MKKITPVLAVTLLIATSASAFAAESATSLLKTSAQDVKSHQWHNGAIAAQQALDLGLTPLQTVVAYNNLCIHLTNELDYAGALNACDKAVELAPERWTSYLNRGNLQAAFGHGAQAAADYAIVQTLNPSGANIARATAAITFGNTSYSNLSFFAALLPPAGVEKMEQRVEVVDKKNRSGDDR